MNSSFKKQKIDFVKKITPWLAGFFIITLMTGATINAANAQAGGQIAVGIGFEIGSFFVGIMHSAASSYLSFTASMLDKAIRMKVDVEVVRGSWEVVRNFANMFFILALIIIAFATIFDIGSFGYAGYDWRTMLVRLIVAAVIINFSLAIGVIFINASQIITNVFLNAIGDSANRLGQALVEATKLSVSDSAVTLAASSGYSLPTFNPGQFVAELVSFGLKFASAGSVDTVALAAIQRLFFTSIVFFILGTSIGVVIVFAIIRIFMLWFLLIVSPLAWVTFIFPKLSRAHGEWWRRFIGWNVFLPIYLFFLYLGLFILSNQATVMSRIFPETNSSTWESGIIGTGFSFQQIFFYLLIVYIMWAGTALAHKASVTAGAGGVAAWGRGQTYAAMRMLPGAGYVTGAGTAAKARLAQLQKEGLPGRFGFFYGGKERLERQEATMGQLFGVRGAETKSQKQYLDRVKREYEEVETSYKSGALTPDQILRTANRMKASDPKGYAYKKMAASLGLADGDFIVKSMQELGNNRLAIEDLSKTLKDSKLPSIIAKDKIALASDPRMPLALRRQLYEHIKSEASVGSFIDDENSSKNFATAVDVLGGRNSKDGADFIKEVGKFRPDVALDYVLKNKEIYDDKVKVAGERINTMKTELPEEYKNLSDDEKEKIAFSIMHFESNISDKVADVAGLHYKGVWKNKEFQRALKNRLARMKEDARKSYIRRLQTAVGTTAFSSGEKTTILGTVLDEFSKENEAQTNKAGLKIRPLVNQSGKSIRGIVEKISDSSQNKENTGAVSSSSSDKPRPPTSQPESPKPLERPPGSPKPLERPPGSPKPLERPPGSPKPLSEWETDEEVDEQYQREQEDAEEEEKRKEEEDKENEEGGEEGEK